MHYSGLKLLLKQIFGDIKSSYKVWTASSGESPFYCLYSIVILQNFVAQLQAQEITMEMSHELLNEECDHAI